MTNHLPTFPTLLRPHIANLLRHHYETNPTVVNLAGSGISVTGATIERASMLSMRMRTCPTCLGTRVQNIHATRGRTIAVPCWRCYGDGEIGEIKKAVMQEQTARCAACKGSGRTPRPEYKRERVYDPKPLKCNRCEGRGYQHIDTVLCGPGKYQSGQPVEGDARSPASKAIARLNALGRERSVFVLSVAYGEVGKHIERRLGLPVAVSLWPHTRHGKVLLSQIGGRGKPPPWRELHECLIGDMEQRTRASMANTLAIAMLELALSHLAKADEETGSQLASSAKRLEATK